MVSNVVELFVYLYHRGVCINSTRWPRERFPTLPSNVPCSALEKLSDQDRVSQATSV